MKKYRLIILSVLVVLLVASMATAADAWGLSFRFGFGHRPARRVVCPPPVVYHPAPVVYPVYVAPVVVAAPVYYAPVPYYYYPPQRCW